jgi:glutaconate CoA-transferase subunit B
MVASRLFFHNVQYANNLFEEVWIMSQYTPFEMIAFTGSRVLEDNKIVFVGTGLPIIASMHAQLTHAPGLGLIFEAGPLAPMLEMGMPLSVGDTRACRKACYLKGLSAVFELTQRGHADYAFIGGAQIDMYGNINSTFEGGNYIEALTRFPGSGGAGAMAANCEKTIAIMALEPRRFVNQCNFVTSIGHGDGSADYREKAGVMGSGPYRVITNEALFGFDEETHRMMLLEVIPGKTAEYIQNKVSFDLMISPNLKEMDEPTEKDLKLLREKCDPDGFFLARKVK